MITKCKFVHMIKCLPVSWFPDMNRFKEFLFRKSVFSIIPIVVLDEDTLLSKLFYYCLITMDPHPIRCSNYLTEI